MKRLPFISCTFLPPLANIRCPLGVSVCLWAFFPVSLISISGIVPVLCLDDYLCSIVLSQRTWFLQLRFLNFFLKIALSILDLSHFHTNCKNFVLVLWKTPLVSWYRLHWICRLLSVVVISQYWLFKSKSTIYLSICLCHPWFFSLASYSYQHTGLLSLLESLFKGILFFLLQC